MYVYVHELSTYFYIQKKNIPFNAFSLQVIIPDFQKQKMILNENMVQSDKCEIMTCS